MTRKPRAGRVTKAMTRPAAAEVERVAKAIYQHMWHPTGEQWGHVWSSAAGRLYFATMARAAIRAMRPARSRKR